MRKLSVVSAFGCVLMLLVAVLLVWPVAEIGISDDWSIYRTAELLARTGHVFYNGWEAPMLGWPLYVAAACFRFIGASFTLARATIASEALIVAFLLHRILVRFGLSAWNASLGTLTVVLSPIFLMSSVTFMTEIPGLLAVLLTLYACQRAVDSGDHAAFWICFAALSNAVLGTARQLSWLGLLMVVPSALVLLRRKRSPLVIGAVAWVCSAGILLGFLYWFGKQPYVLPEHLLPDLLPRGILHRVVATNVRMLLDLMLLAFPVPLAFFTLRRVSGWQRVTVPVVVVVCIAVAVWVGARTDWLAPFLFFKPVPPTLENLFLNAPMPALGVPPASLPTWLRPALTVIALAAFASFIVGLLLRPKATHTPHTEQDQVRWRELLTLLGPFVICYGVLLMPRALTVFTVDRYLLFLLPAFVALLLGVYQTYLGPQLPRAAVLGVLILGAYSVTTLHDEFASYRATAAVTRELLKAGVPREEINGGVEFNFMTQILREGYVHAQGIRMPDRSILQAAPSRPVGPCDQPVLEILPAVHPRFSVANPSAPCARAVEFAPVRFRTWLPPFQRVVWVDRYGQVAAEKN